MRRANKRPLVTSALIAVLGLPLLWLGGQLMLSGGTPYYLAGGFLMVVTSYYLFQSKPTGFYIYAVLVLVTLGWAVYEAGNSFWLVGSRIWIVGFIGLWLCTPWIRKMLWPIDTPALFSMRIVQVCAAATLSVLLGMVISLFNPPKPCLLYTSPSPRD